MSQVELARRAGLSAATISNVERGELPTVRTAIAIARVLGVGLDVLLPVTPAEVGS
jgi:transcriptional regulator with XRE-family HTH domain